MNAWIKKRTLYKLHTLFKKWCIDKWDKRDLTIISFSIILNIAFGLEKFFIVFFKPLPDILWMIVYLWMWLYIARIALRDYVYDEIEEESHNNTIDILI